MPTPPCSQGRQPAPPHASDSGAALERRQGDPAVWPLAPQQPGAQRPGGRRGSLLPNATAVGSVPSRARARLCSDPPCPLPRPFQRQVSAPIYRLLISQCGGEWRFAGARQGVAPGRGAAFPQHLGHGGMHASALSFQPIRLPRPARLQQAPWPSAWQASARCSRATGARWARGRRSKILILRTGQGAGGEHVLLRGRPWHGAGASHCVLRQPPFAQCMEVCWQCGLSLPAPNPLLHLQVGPRGPVAPLRRGSGLRGPAPPRRQGAAAAGAWAGPVGWNVCWGSGCAFVRLAAVPHADAFAGYRRRPAALRVDEDAAGHPPQGARLGPCRSGGHPVVHSFRSHTFACPRICMARTLCAGGLACIFSAPPPSIPTTRHLALAAGGAHHAGRQHLLRLGHRQRGVLRHGEHTRRAAPDSFAECPYTVLACGHLDLPAPSPPSQTANKGNIPRFLNRLLGLSIPEQQVLALGEGFSVGACQSQAHPLNPNLV